jgi:hypothetical protein
MKKPKLVSIAEYATMSGVTQQAIYSRLKSGEIVPTLVPYGKGHIKLIDVNVYAPKQLKSGRKPFKGVK